MWDRITIKEKANASYHANYWPCVLAGLLMAIADGTLGQSVQSVNQMTGGNDEVNTMVAGIVVICGIVGIVVGIFLLGPLEIGCSRFFLINQLKNGADLNEVGFGFNVNYSKNVKTMFIRGLYIFLWTLLLIVPGVIKAYEYRLVPYIVCERPDIETDEALALSKKLMDGNKMDAFVYDLSFIGWYILGALTLGIVDLLKTQPYKYSADAELYLAIRAHHDL